MVNSVAASPLALLQGQTALTLLSGAANPDTAISDGILSAYQASFSTPNASTFGSAVATPPTAPWSAPGGTPTAASAIQNAMSGQPFVNPGTAKLDAPAGVSSQDYKNLFALYQGLNSLYDIANAAAQTGSATADPTTSNFNPAQLQAAFASGMSQVENFLSNDPFKEFNLTAGKVQTSAESSVGIPNGTYQTYTTGVIATGDESQPLSAFQGDVQFNITVASKYATTTIKNPDGTTKTVTTPPTVVPIDLSGMSGPRTIDNVVNYINTQLKAAKVTTRFSAANLGTTASTTTLPNGQKQTNKGTTQWGLTVNGSSGEIVSFSAPSTAAAIYVSSATGGASTWKAPGTDPITGQPTPGGQSTTDTGQQMMKLQTGNDVVGTQPPTITNAGSTTGLPSGAVFAKTLPSGVSNVSASATAPDGSVYELADATGTVNNQPVQGGKGVVLLKYDSSGKLLSTKMVPGLETASGSSISVGADGTVAVVGTNTTNATTSAAGLTTPGTTSAFVQVYDPTGAATWSQTIPAVGGTSGASGVVVGTDGSVYVSGLTTGSVGNQIEHGDQDEFIQGFNKTGVATFTKQFGSKGTNTSAGLTYDPATGTLYTAGLENSQTVVRSFAVNTTTTGTGKSAKTTTTATQTATRSLGFANDLVGIGFTNGQVVVGGTVGAATITGAGTVTSAYTGVSDGFMASIGSSLTPSSGDTVAYFGKSGATQVATAMTVAGGQAYLTGGINNDPSSLAAPNATEGFVAGVDAATGAVTYSTRLAGVNGQDTPTAISVATTGSSVLDQLGLPQGTINGTTSNLITGSTAIKAGQSFWVRTSPGGPQTQITIKATDTLQTLADKLNTAMAGQAKATVLSLGANSQLEITPNSSSSFVELDSQEASNNNPSATASSLNIDVLAALGLSSGVIRQVRQVNKLTDVTQLREYGLNLPTNLDLSTTANAQHAANALQAAMSAVMSAYKDLANPPTMAQEALSAEQNSGGTAPAYLTSEISNLQAGLARLTGGASNSSGSSGGATTGNIALTLLGG